MFCGIWLWGRSNSVKTQSVSCSIETGWKRSTS